MLHYRHLLRRSGQLLAVTVVAVTAVAHYGAGAALAKPAPPPLALIGSDGSVVDAASLLAPDRAGLAGFAGAGLSSEDSSGAEDGTGILSLIGPDDRQRTSPTTGSVPSRSTVALTYTVDGKTELGCSGWMFGPDTVITAGHCVYDPREGDWVEGTIVATPARNTPSSPYGACSVRTRFTVTAWAYDANRNYDFGALKLNCDVGNTTGWMGVWWTTRSLVDTYVFVRGYPCDQLHGTQWWDAGDVVAANSNRLFYQIDTYNCQSGSPVYNHVTGSNCTCVLGIHTTGAGSTGQNGATRITQQVAEWLYYWRNR